MALQSGGKARYAIYWAPPEGTTLAKLGAAWLGRDASTGQSLKRFAIKGFDDDALADITAEPRRYGLHATLKAPFALAKNRSLRELEADLDAFTSGNAPIVAPSLHLTRLGNFLAMIPTAPTPAINALANSCVERFDCYRAPPTEHELRRRRAAHLTAAQEKNLQRWGYPYVMHEFRFHVSLTGPIIPAVADRLLPELSSLFAPIASEPLELREIVLFAEPEPGAPFRPLQRFAFTGR